MAQIDKVAYIPLLVWFILLFIVIYIFVYSFFLTVFILTFKTRNKYVEELMNLIVTSYNIINLFYFIIIEGLTKNTFNILYFYVQHKNIFNRKTHTKNYFIF